MMENLSRGNKNLIFISTFLLVMLYAFYAFYSEITRYSSYDDVSEILSILKSNYIIEVSERYDDDERVLTIVTEDGSQFVNFYGPKYSKKRIDADGSLDQFQIKNTKHFLTTIANYVVEDAYKESAASFINHSVDALRPDATTSFKTGNWLLSLENLGENIFMEIQPSGFSQ